MPDRPTKITFAEMRGSGVRRLLGYCVDYHFSHSIAIGCRALSQPEQPHVDAECGHIRIATRRHSQSNFSFGRSPR
jgi:hypothetical protein